MSTYRSTFPILGSSSTSEGWDWSAAIVTQCSGALHIILNIVLIQITRDGRIVDEGIIRVNNARKEHKARSKGVLATSIINRAIEIEVNLLILSEECCFIICIYSCMVYRENAEVS